MGPCQTTLNQLVNLKCVAFVLLPWPSPNFSAKDEDDFELFGDAAEEEPPEEEVNIFPRWKALGLFELLVPGKPMENLISSIDFVRTCPIQAAIRIHGLQAEEAPDDGKKKKKKGRDC